MTRRAFLDAATELRRAHRTGGSLCGPFTSAMPGTSAALTTLGASFGDETLCASDEGAARLDELQIDLGEGPSWQSVRDRAPVVDLDFLRVPSPWPVFADAAAGLTTRCVVAFPLSVGTLEMGAIGLYADEPDTLARHDMTAIATLVKIAATQVLRRVYSRLQEAPDDSYSRREVHQATGMVVAQLEVPAAEALVIIRAHAFAAGVTVRALAIEIIARRIDLADA